MLKAPWVSWLAIKATKNASLSDQKSGSDVMTRIAKRGKDEETIAS